MKWLLIDKSGTIQPAPKNGIKYGTHEYRDWKEILANEGKRQCVYCAIPDSKMGIYNFQVEHFMPQKHFPDLIYNITNLFYVCPICNKFKGKDFCMTVLNKNYKILYPDPSERDYNTLFSIDNNGYVKGKSSISKYLINKLALNRNQLILERKQSLLFEEFSNIKIRIRQLISKLKDTEDLEASEFLALISEFLLKIDEKRKKLLDSTPYDLKDTKR